VIIINADPQAGERRIKVTRDLLPIQKKNLHLIMAGKQREVSAQSLHPVQVTRIAKETGL
jgi:hypothetical protein